MGAHVKKLWMPLALLVGVVVLIAFANARPAGLSYGVTIGPLPQCPMGGTKTTRDPIGRIDIAQNNVQANFNVVAATPFGAQNPRVVLTPTAITATSISPQYGQIVYTLDPNRTPTPTTVAGTVPGAQFPAAVNIFLPVLATVTAFPGQTFRSIGEVHLQSPNAQSFNPFNGQDVFNLVAPSSGVGFEDVNNPGQVVFSLTSVTLQ